MAAFLPLQAHAEKTIKLGFIGPLSGGSSMQGIGAANSFRLAIQQANAGDYPYEVEPVVLDDASKPSTGVNAALKLTNDPKVVAATGHWNSPVALATIPVFERANMPFIIWGAISPKITEQDVPEVTRVTPTLAQENKPLADWLVNDLGYDKIAVVSTTDNYGQENVEAFTEYANNHGAEIVSTDSVPTDTTNFQSVLSSIKASDAEMIYFGGVIAPAGILRKQMASLDMDMPVAGISGIYDPKYLELAGDAADGTLVTVPGAKEIPAFEAFKQAYKEADFDNPMGPYGKYAFDAANILLKVIREHGPDDAEKLSKAIRNISYDGALGTTTFDANGQTQVKITTEQYVAEDGEWVSYGESSYADN
jgi:branched-chain amino acid transport system substrate-binding protein